MNQTRVTAITGKTRVLRVNQTIVNPPLGWMTWHSYAHVTHWPSYIHNRPHQRNTTEPGERERNTRTHTQPFNGPLSGTTRVSRYQKGKTNLDFTETRDSEWQWHQRGHMQVCTSLQTDNHASTPPLVFLQAGCPSCHPTNSVKALKAVSQTYQQSVFKRYRSDKHFSEFLPTRWWQKSTGIDMEQNYFTVTVCIHIHSNKTGAWQLGSVIDLTNSCSHAKFHLEWCRGMAYVQEPVTATI